MRVARAVRAVPLLAIAAAAAIATGCPARPAGGPDGAGGPPSPSPSPSPSLFPSAPAAPAASSGDAFTAATVPDAATAASTGVAPALETRVETITITLLVDPPKKARVFWGAKDLGLAPLEIRRPRGSGPVDLELRAPGFLTMHTRAFTDRDDRISLRLTPKEEAPRVFGYRATDPKAASTRPAGAGGQAGRVGR